MCVVELIIGKRLVKSDVSFFEKKTIIILTTLVIIQFFIYNTTFNIANVLLTFFVNILFFKLIFNIKIEDAIICCGLYMIILSVSDMITSIIMGLFYTPIEIRTNIAALLISNIMVGVLSISIVNTKYTYNMFKTFIKISSNKGQIVNGIFILLGTSCFVCLFYNISISKQHDIKYFINFIIMFLLAEILYIFIKEKIKYSQLNDKYNMLFGYVQNFEEWIERDQLNRHEYKNQLAVIRSITKDKSVIKKINDLLDDNIKIKGDAVYKLKELPTGGLKGLMYYKVAIAQKQNINIEVDVSLKRKSEFKKLNEHKIKVLSNLIGIYFDNAIESALETEEKNVCLEVYEIKDGIKFVISNTFKRNENFDRRNERGVTSKGKGHGNGLYYANNLISKNNWLEASQETIDNYYIQNIIIKKLD